MTKFKNGNAAAAKPPDQHQTAKVVVALTPAEKAEWIQLAYPKSISHMVREAVQAHVQLVPLAEMSE